MTFWRALAGFAVLWAVMSLTYPFGWDQGILSWAGGVVRAGGMPYRDAWDMKGPVVYYLFALPQAVFGVNLWGIRVLDLVLLMTSAICVGRVVSTLTDVVAGRWSVVFFVLWYASHSYWNTAQPDGWSAMLLAAVVLPRLVRQGSAGLLSSGMIGVAIGVTSLIKPTYAVFLVVPFVALVSSRTVPGNRRLAAGAACLAGWLLPVSLCVFWFAQRGALDDLLAVYLRYPASAYAEVSTVGPLARARGIVEYFLQAPVMAVGLPLAIVGALVLWQTRRTLSLVLVAWLLLAVGMVAVQGRFFGYHWLPIMPAAVVLGAVGLHSVLPRARMLALALTVVLAASCLAPIVVEEVRFLAWAGGVIDRATYYDGYGEPGNDMRAVAWLRSEGSDGKVFVFGWNTSIAWLSGHEIVSRFGFSMPLLLGDHSAIRADYRAEVMRALLADPPKYIILGTQSSQILRRSMTVADFPELADLVRGSYRKVAEFGSLEIHERARKG